MIDAALFGAGRIGKIHAANLVRLPGMRLKYVVDSHAPAAREPPPTAPRPAPRNKRWTIPRCAPSSSPPAPTPTPN